MGKLRPREERAWSYASHPTVQQTLPEPAVPLGRARPGNEPQDTARFWLKIAKSQLITAGPGRQHQPQGVSGEGAGPGKEVGATPTFSGLHLGEVGPGRGQGGGDGYSPRSLLVTSQGRGLLKAKIPGV